MATKKTKTKAKKPIPVKIVSESPPSYVEPVSVRVQKASNGYVISSYGTKGEIVKVAKNMAEVNKTVKGMMRKK